jgi:2'-5' RNA ligase
MRLFVAIDLPDTLRAWAVRSGAALRDRLSGSKSRITWIAAEQLHLTLVFLGEVPDATGEDVTVRLGEPFAAPAFALRLGAAGAFPSAGRPRTVWLAIEEGRTALGRIHQAVLARLADVAYRREERPYVPHLTIARVRDGGTSADRRAIDDAPLGTPERALIDHVTLYQSRLTPRGPEYTARARGGLAPLEAE